MTQRPPRLDSADAKQPTPETRYRVAHAWLLAAQYLYLEAEAARRGIHVDVLAAELIGIIIENNAYSAVLGR